MAVSVLARRAFRDGRVRTIAFAYLFALVGYANVVGYRHSYPTAASRLAFAHSFGNNGAVRLFYGTPFNLLSTGGYVAWRVGGTLAIFAAVWGLFAAVRALRTEEDAGRMELVLAAPVARQQAFVAALAAVGAGALLLWLACFAGLAVTGLPLGGSAYLALSELTVIGVSVGVSGLISQVAPSRRLALQLGGGVVLVEFVLRVIADTASRAGWLRWATPLGWAEELRPFTGARPAVLLIPACVTALTLFASARIAMRRDVGTGLLTVGESARPRLGLLSSPLAHGFRLERGSLAGWMVGVSAFAVVLGVISKSISSAGIPKSAERTLAKLGAGSVLTPRGYLGFSFIFFVLAISIFACSQIAAARHEESEGRLETLLSLPASRRVWLGGRLLIAAASAASISLIAGALAWVGAASAGVSMSLAKMLEAGANCLPVTILFLGLAALLYAAFPRPGPGIAYALVSAAFVWQLFGSVLGAPTWLLDVSPFRHVGLVPAQSFRAGAAAIMVAIGAAGSLAAVAVFARRDLSGA